MLKSKKLLPLALLFCLSSPTLPSLAAPFNAEEAQQNSQALHQKLEALGSFEAHYTAISPNNQRANIHLLYNKQRKYILAKVEISDDTAKWLVLDYAQLQGPQKQFDMIIVTSEWKQIFDVSLSRLQQQFQNPLGAAYFLAKNIPNAPSEKSLIQALQPGASLISLGLDDSDLNLTLGLSTQAGKLQASWLSPESWSKAKDVKRKDKNLELHFPNEHLLRIDLATGLLQHDSWPDPERPGPREINLKSYGKLSQDKPYSELLPNLTDLPDGEMPPNMFEQILYPVFLTELAYTLKDSEALEQLKTDPEGQRLKLRALIRTQMKANGGFPLQPKLAKAYFENQLWPMYTSYREQEQSELSFADFVADMRKAAPNDLSRVSLPPGFRENLGKMQQETEQALKQMPEAAQESMLILLQVGMPAVWEAMLMESLDAYLDAALKLAQSKP